MTSFSSSTNTARPLKKMFDAVPKHYDLLNRLFTFFIDEKWRKQTAQLCLANHPNRILDLCCGTGDLTVHLLQQSEQHAEITALDFSPAMLNHTRKKIVSLIKNYPPMLVESNASTMPFPTDHFDTIGISFGFRNLTWFNRLSDSVLQEIRRVLKPGGYFVILESSQPKNGLIKFLFHTYLNQLVRPLGNFISGHKSAYRYLAQSASTYYTAEQLTDLLSEADFNVTRVQPLLGGIAAIHVAQKK